MYSINPNWGWFPLDHISPSHSSLQDHLTTGGHNPWFSHPGHHRSPVRGSPQCVDDPPGHGSPRYMADTPDAACCIVPLGNCLCKPRGARSSWRCLQVKGATGSDLGWWT